MSTPDRTHTGNAGAAALWASAFVLMALIITRAGDAGQAADAGTSKFGTVTVSALRTLDGSNDLIVVADDRTDELFVYRFADGTELTLVQYGPAAVLFPEPPAAAP